MSPLLAKLHTQLVMSAFSRALYQLILLAISISFHHFAFSVSVVSIIFIMVDLNFTPPKSPAAKLRAMLAKEMVVCPGVYNGFTARLALNAGFKVLYMVQLSFTSLNYRI
jgi:hypothetical protein